MDFFISFPQLICVRVCLWKWIGRRGSSVEQEFTVKLHMLYRGVVLPNWRGGGKVIRPWLELDVPLPFSTERDTSVPIQKQTHAVHNKSVLSAHSISYYIICALYSDCKGFWHFGHCPCSRFIKKQLYENWTFSVLRLERKDGVPVLLDRSGRASRCLSTG